LPFFTRYFYPLLIACIILSASVVSFIPGTYRKAIIAISLVVFSAYALFQAGPIVERTKFLQEGRYAMLREMGEFINSETQPDAKGKCEIPGRNGQTEGYFLGC